MRAHIYDGKRLINAPDSETRRTAAGGGYIHKLAKEESNGESPESPADRMLRLEHERRERHAARVAVDRIGQHHCADAE